MLPTDSSAPSLNGHLTSVATDSSAPSLNGHVTSVATDSSAPSLNGHLVYVRRKSEGETSKITTVNASCPLYCQEEIAPKLSSFPPFSPFPMPSTNPSIPSKVFKYLLWEERYQHLLAFLRILDQSDQADYIQMLQSLSSVELSRHAVELEKRSIQLSLEEAKELQRVAALNVLGKSVNNFKAPADHAECSDKLKTFT
ncbi:unnamed protein product [Vicia faba]|uniref:Uncharacterized protein n=1 Tax=Vicia faba TaxID=3906 RepID=A0AAV1APA4_VICFA|nr:unnamed protein product [Vicia faba]